MERHKCLECGLTLRNYENGKPKIHRKCWLMIRSSQDRCVDFLFCRDRRKETLKKMKVIEPTFEKSETTPLISQSQGDETPRIIDIGGNEIEIPSHFFIGVDPQEENKMLEQIIDVAGNFIISPSSSPPLALSPLSLIQNSAELDFLP
jgi:hypothetical protein